MTSVLALYCDEDDNKEWAGAEKNGGRRKNLSLLAKYKIKDKHPGLRHAQKTSRVIYSASEVGEGESVS